MLDKERFLVVSEHGFLLQMEKGEITKCGQYKGEYTCALVKGQIKTLSKLPKKCPVVDGSDPTTLCPIVWLLTCYKEKMLKRKDVDMIMKGEYELEDTNTPSIDDSSHLEMVENKERLRQQREELLIMNEQLTELTRLIQEKEEYFKSIEGNSPNGESEALVEKEALLDGRENELDER